MRTNHQLRIITGLIYGFAIILALTTVHLAFVFIFLILNGLVLWEFFNLCQIHSQTYRIVGVVFGSIPFILFYIFESLIFEPIFLALLVACLIFYALLSYALFKHKKIDFHLKSPLTSGLLYIGLSFTCLHYLVYDNIAGFAGWKVLAIFVLLWANDSFAYFIGRKIGKTPLFPAVSPKKTWEGFIGGVVVTMLTALLAAALFPQIPTMKWVVTAAIVATTGSVGDLVESAFKRCVKIKDSGKLLPGHGGFLDRLDSFVFAVPFVCAFWYFW